MPLWKDTPTEEEHAPHRGMQGPSRRFATSHTYPNPASVGTQTLQASNPYKGYSQPSTADTMALESDSHLLPDFMLLSETRHETVCYSQSRATSLTTNVLGGHGVSPYTPSSLNYNSTLDPALREIDFWSSQSLDFNQQLIQASSLGNQYNGSSFRDTNMPAQGTNNATEDYPKSPDHPYAIYPQYIPPPPTNELAGVENCSTRGKKRLSDSGLGAHRHEELDQSASWDQQPKKKQRVSTRPRTAVGGNNSAEAHYRVVNGDKFVLVDHEWKRAGHHVDFREELIMLDAQQPGAPVWRRGMDTNCTSYSPMTRHWTEDPSSITDSKGQKVMFLPVRPPHLPHNPKCGYLMCEGLVMLDQDNGPIKAYPGAPRTLSTDIAHSPGYLLQGLRSILGMTVEDLRARMLIERDTKSGIRDLQRGTALTNRMNFWRWKKNLPTWHLRRPRKATNTEGTIPSGGSNEGESITVSVPDSTIQSMQGLDDLGSENVEWDDFVDLENPNEDE